MEAKQKIQKKLIMFDFIFDIDHYLIKKCFCSWTDNRKSIFQKQKTIFSYK